MERSRSDKENVLANNLMIQAELGAVARILCAAGVEFVVLKGVPLAEGLHGNLAVRPLCDNDILVRRRDVGRACDALIGEGFATPDPWTLETALNTNHEYTLWRDTPSGRSLVDLHWCVFPPDLYPCAEELIWQRTVPFSIGGVEALAPDAELTLVSLAVQATMHLCAEKVRFGELALAWQAADAETRQRTLALADTTGTRKTLAFCLAICQELDFACDGGDASNAPTWLQPLAVRIGAVLARDGEPPSRALAYALPLALVPAPRALRWFATEVFLPSEQLSVAASGERTPSGAAGTMAGSLGRYWGRIYQLFRR